MDIKREKIIPIDIVDEMRSSYLDYSMSNLDLGRKVDATNIQVMYGAGVRLKYLFVEYVNYGRRDSMYMEQLRAGLRFSF